MSHAHKAAFLCEFLLSAFSSSINPMDVVFISMTDAAPLPHLHFSLQEGKSEQDQSKKSPFNLMNTLLCSYSIGENLLQSLTWLIRVTTTEIVPSSVATCPEKERGKYWKGITGRLPESVLWQPFISAHSASKKWTHSSSKGQSPRSYPITSSSTNLRICG